jgi:hypothetical protein
VTGPDSDVTPARKPANRAFLQLAVAGIVLIALVAGISLISKRFVFGVDHAGRPVILFTTLYLLCWPAFAWACRVAARCAEDRRALALVLVVAALLRLLLCFSNPILENDFYRYIWDGHVLAQGLNPYAFAPADYVVADIEPDPGELAAATHVHSRINYPDVKTIYPHLAQAVFAANGHVFGWTPYGFRWTFLVFDLLLLVILMRVVRDEGLPPATIVWYAWCPLVLKEITNAMHVDIVSACFLGVYVWAVCRGRLVLAAVAAVASAYVKLTPAVLAALVVCALWHQRRRWLAGGLCVLGAAVMLLSWGLMEWNATAPLTGLLTFSREWQTNGSCYPLLANGLQLLGLAEESALRITRLTLAGVFGGFVLLACRAVRDRQALLSWSLLLLLLLFLFAPVGNPWYLVWLTPFLVVRRNWLVLLLFAVTSCYYLTFRLIYADAGTAQYHVLKACEYLPFYAAAGWWLWRRRADVCAFLLPPPAARPPDQAELSPSGG